MTTADDANADNAKGRLQRFFDWIEGTQRRRAIFRYGWALLFGLGPWLELCGLPGTPHRWVQLMLIIAGLLYGAMAVALAALYVFSPGIQHLPGLILCAVLSAVSYLEGEFAVLYFIWSQTSNTAFSSAMSRPDAVYFAISTATSTGMGDIHPVSGGARLWVTGQMVLSVFLIVLALGIAATRLAGREKIAGLSRPR